MTTLPNPFFADAEPDIEPVDEHRFVFDERRFLADLAGDPSPIFIAEPSPEYLEALPVRRAVGRR